MKKAIYQLDGGQTKTLDVLKKNSDGTFDLGLKGVPLVTGVKLVKKPVVGACTAAGKSEEAGPETSLEEGLLKDPPADNGGEPVTPPAP